jgi:hypothetical protein
MGPFSDPMGFMGGMGGAPAAPQQNLGFGAMAPGGMPAWGGTVSPEEIERLRRLREAAMAGGFGVNPAAMDAHMTAQAAAPGQAPLPVPPAWAPPPAAPGRPPAAPGAPGAPPVAAAPPPAISSLPALPQEGPMGDDRPWWQRAGDWVNRQMTPNAQAYAAALGRPGAGQGGMSQGLQAVGSAGARMMAPPPQQPQQMISHQPTPSGRGGRGAPLPIRPGPMDRQRQAAAQRRRGILDE